MRVLVVEDDRPVREGLCFALERRGYSVAQAANVRQAKRLTESDPPDVVISDWQLGDADGDGVDVARHAHRCCQAKVILVTAHDPETLREQAGDLDIVALLRKPISIHTIFASLDRL
jgi:DNA-binding response OmpR family regulator